MTCPGLYTGLLIAGIVATIVWTAVLGWAMWLGLASLAVWLSDVLGAQSA